MGGGKRDASGGTPPDLSRVSRRLERRRRCDGGEGPLRGRCRGALQLHRDARELRRPLSDRHPVSRQRRRLPRRPALERSHRLEDHVRSRLSNIASGKHRGLGSTHTGNGTASSGQTGLQVLACALVARPAI